MLFINTHESCKEGFFFYRIVVIKADSFAVNLFCGEKKTLHNNFVYFMHTHDFLWETWEG